jgi:hypothetical protein
MSEEPNEPRGQAIIADWRMTEVTLPERPDDSEWRKKIALRLLPLAALVVVECVSFFDVKWAVIVGTVLFPVIGAWEFHTRRRSN